MGMSFESGKFDSEPPIPDGELGYDDRLELRHILEESGVRLTSIDPESVD
jgi:hypothetical protein